MEELIINGNKKYLINTVEELYYKLCNIRDDTTDKDIKDDLEECIYCIDNNKFK